MSHLIVHVGLLTLMGNEGTDLRSHGVLYCAFGVLSFEDSKCSGFELMTYRSIVYSPTHCAMLWNLGSADSGIQDANKA
uniref:Uncharacterized protein n=1 Tax=Magallana gigas TaxID=29159 RepID=K1QLD9_MAGGI